MSGKALRWNVAALARERGITNPSALGAAMGLSRQGLYGIWQGTAQLVSLHILALLAHVLDADPGDWFVRAAPGAESPGAGFDVLRAAGDAAALHTQHPALAWNVRAAVEARGLDAPRFGFKTELHTRSVGFIWRGEAQAIAIETLGKIARVLDRPDLPFSIGTIFVWNDLRSDERQRGSVDDREFLA